MGAYIKSSSVRETSTKSFFIMNVFIIDAYIDVGIKLSSIR